MSTERLLRDYSHCGPDKLCYLPKISAEDGDVQEYLLYFISGNPGLISFYEPFLTKLYELRSRSAHPRFHICGHSYKGFEVDPNAQKHGGPFSLAEQIKDQENRLYRHVRRHSPSTGKPPKVILVGHSVGAYVLLELIREHKQSIARTEQEDFDLIGAVLLFPTIKDIAESPLGRWAKWILPLPGFALVMGALAKGLGSILPEKILTRLVGAITRFPNYAAVATTSFIKSSMGVRQALHLARDEMKTITDDKWKQEVWGAAISPGTNDRDTISWNNYTYWGHNDKWVANETRDHMMQARGEVAPPAAPGNTVNMQPRMEVDRQGIPHDFCTTIRNSNIMAERVDRWIDDIISAHYQAISR